MAPADARAPTGVRGVVAALAARREFARGLLIVADTAAVSFALGVGVQLVAGLPLSPAAMLAIPFIVVVARLFGLYERPGRGLGRSTLTDVPRQCQLATLTALLASMLGDHLTPAVWGAGATLIVLEATSS